jgi:hypothetical protein
VLSRRKFCFAAGSGRRAEIGVLRSLQARRAALGGENKDRAACGQAGTRPRRGPFEAFELDLAVLWQDVQL